MEEITYLYSKKEYDKKKENVNILNNIQIENGNHFGNKKIK